MFEIRRFKNKRKDGWMLKLLHLLTAEIQNIHCKQRERDKETENESKKEEGRQIMRGGRKECAYMCLCVAVGLMRLTFPSATSPSPPRDRPVG